MKLKYVGLWKLKFVGFSQKQILKFFLLQTLYFFFFMTKQNKFSFDKRFFTHFPCIIIWKTCLIGNYLGHELIPLEYSQYLSFLYWHKAPIIIKKNSAVVIQTTISEYYKFLMLNLSVCIWIAISLLFPHTPKGLNNSVQNCSYTTNNNNNYTIHGLCLIVGCS